MQNNKVLEKEIKRNSNTVFMSESLDSLLDNREVSNTKSIICSVKTDNRLIDFNLQAKESFDNFYLISFMSKIESVLNLEKEEILDISLKFEEDTLKSFSKDYYKFNLSWKQENNNYLVDIFINKRGD